MTVNAEYRGAGVSRANVARRLGMPLAALVLGLGLAPATAMAQGVGAAHNTAGQTSTAQALDAALARLARNPRDIDSLVAAGRAALALGDTDAATGFFSRADKLAPGTPKVLAGMAVAKVRARDPLTALPLFDMADKGGALSPDDIADMGLAYDLVGDNRSAQGLYRRALAGGVQGEAARRLVLSYAIAGDRAASDAALRPLLDASDRAAIRTQAFALAILGREDEAVAVVQASMPPELATAIAPYLRYMRKLTSAQQAAAANLGEFPHAADIGVDDPRIAQYAADHHLHRPVAEVAVAQVATPSGARGKTRGSARRKVPAPAAPDASGASPPEFSPSREEVAAAAPAPPAAPSRAPVEPAPAPYAARVVTQTVPAAHPYGPVENEPHPADAAGASVKMDYASAPGPVAISGPPPAAAAVPAPSVSVAVVQPLPAGAARPAAPAPARHRLNFADAFASMGENAPVFEPAPGAVDIRKIEPPRQPVRPAPHAAPKPPPPPAHPSRIWVELGVGRDTDRLGFDWHRFAKDDPDLFAHHKPFVTGWARTNRLLTGPFDTQEAADAYAQQLRKAGHDGVFVWTSPAGQVVDPLDAR